MIQRLILLALFIAPVVVGAQSLVLDTARGVVGKEVAMAIRLGPGYGDSLTEHTVTGTFHLSNPSVFFPDGFAPAGGWEIVAQGLTRLTDSTYAFAFTVSGTGAEQSRSDTLCLLSGEALAGYDSVCIVRFRDLAIDGRTSPAAIGLVLIRSIGTPLPYVRFATLERGYPNPARRGSRVTWAFRIDKPSPVTFHIYSIDGRELWRDEMGLIEPGIYLEHFEVNFAVAAGVYMVHLETNTGNVYQFMHVVK